MNMLKMNVMKWISPREMIPEYGKDVLIYILGQDGKFRVNLAAIGPEDKFYNPGGHKIENVVCWTPFIPPEESYISEESKSMRKFLEAEKKRKTQLYYSYRGVE